MLLILLQAQRCKSSSLRKAFASHQFQRGWLTTGSKNLTGGTKEPEMGCTLMAMRGRMWWPINVHLLSGGNFMTSISTSGTTMDVNSHAQSDSHCPIMAHSDLSSSLTMSPHFTRTTAARLHGPRQPVDQCHSPKAMASRSWSWTS